MAFDDAMLHRKLLLNTRFYLVSLMEMGKFVPQFLREFSVEWTGEEEWKVESSWFAKQTGIKVRIRKRT